ncbi:ACH96224.1 OrNV gp094-like protein [Kallithea virus]|uniref:ACH96224.1 OrNV gp094-like protein n=1 Tax=Kallithea virus TaxID=1654582 RepID=A0A1S5VG40_9VIRU|nr:ACH96224.1 OrNV gp094-like protein [Kallithea virus]AQN78611.1 ACH96224.1 OrNV gp094-like protein [Kallithea virus]
MQHSNHKPSVSPIAFVTNTTQRCRCEFENDETRIKCLVGEYKKLMEFRRKPLTNARIQILESTARLSDVNLINCTYQTTTELLAESQILYTFVQTYVKTHPGFLIDGPEIGSIRLKTDFFSST